MVNRNVGAILGRTVDFHDIHSARDSGDNHPELGLVRSLTKTGRLVDDY